MSVRLCLRRSFLVQSMVINTDIGTWVHFCFYSEDEAIPIRYQLKALVNTYSDMDAFKLTVIINDRSREPALEML